MKKIEKVMRRIVVLGFILICFVAIFLFLRDGNKDSVKDNASNDPYVIGLVLSNLQNPFFKSLAAEAKNEADRQGVILTILDSSDSAGLEYQHVSGLVDRHVDCIIVNPTDSDTVFQAIQYANDKNIPVLTVDRTSNGGLVVCHIESDNLAGGELIASYLIDQTGNKGSYVEMKGIEGTSAAQTRSKGFNDRMAKDSNMSRAAVVTADFDRNKGREAMASLLGVHPNLTALFAHNDEMALGAAEIAHDLKSPVLIFGFDGTQEAIEAIETGAMVATIGQRPDLLGKTALEKAVTYLKEKKVEALVLVDVLLITKDSD